MPNAIQTLGQAVMILNIGLILYVIGDAAVIGETAAAWLPSWIRGLGALLVVVAGIMQVLGKKAF